MYFKALAPAVALLMGTPAIAQPIIGDCESSLVGKLLPEVSPDGFVSFADGAVRIADLYVDGNLASNVVIVVLHPRQSDLAGAGYYQACTVVYSGRTLSPYFGRVLLRDLIADYDADSGLKITIPVEYYFTDRDVENGKLTLIVHQKDGYVDAEER